MSEQKPTAERRNDPRIEWSGDVVLEIGNQRIKCRGVDLSQTGIRLIGSWVGYQGQHVKVKLDLDGEPAFALGEVAWAGQGSRTEGWGIRFTSVHPATRRRIAEFVIGSLEADRQDSGEAGAPPRAPEASPRPAQLPGPLAPTAPDGAPATVPVVACDPDLRVRIDRLLQSGRLGSAAVLDGAKGAVAFRGQLYVQFGTGPVVVLPPGDPLAQKLRWIAASAATWAEKEADLAHGPERPLRIRV